MLSFYKKKTKEILLFQITANFAYAVHYFLLGALSGAYISIVSVVRNILFLLLKNNKKIVAIFIILIYLIITVIFYENIYSILPMFANSIYVFSILKDNKLSLLKGQFVGSLLWLIYGVFVLSYSEMITETILCISSIIQIKKLNKN